MGGSRPIKQEICQFPFVIGRDASADFRVDSSRVSRKHVLIDRGPNGQYVLRDLESTNGTYVNGKRISEVESGRRRRDRHGGFRMTFFSGSLPTRSSATQVMTQPVGGRLTEAMDLIIQVRRLHEASDSPIGHEPLSADRFGWTRVQVYGYEAIRELEDLPGRAAGRRRRSIVTERSAG